jgi:hypothetical protein
MQHFRPIEWCTFGINYTMNAFRRFQQRVIEHIYDNVRRIPPAIGMEFYCDPVCIEFPDFDKFPRQIMNNVYVREWTYFNYNWYLDLAPIELARSGFYYSGEEDFVTCFNCHLKIGYFTSGTFVHHIHKSMSPNCTYAHEHIMYNPPVPVPHKTVGRLQDIAYLSLMAKFRKSEYEEFYLNLLKDQIPAKLHEIIKFIEAYPIMHNDWTPYSARLYYYELAQTKWCPYHQPDRFTPFDMITYSDQILKFFHLIQLEMYNERLEYDLMCESRRQRGLDKHEGLGQDTVC